MPLDVVDKNNGTMRIVKASHKWGKQYHPVRIGVGDMVDGAEDFDGAVPDIDTNLNEYDVISWNLSSGDCLAFHGKMLHGAFANISFDRRRRARSRRLTGDDIVWASKTYAPTETSLPDLIPGNRIDCDDYPVLWSIQ